MLILPAAKRFSKEKIQQRKDLAKKRFSKEKI
jgi:hypothetical protein